MTGDAQPAAGEPGPAAGELAESGPSPAGDPGWSSGGHGRGAGPERVALGGVLVAAAGLYLWRLDRNGWANEYYAAAVRSMTQSWHNFFYGAFDPGGFITVDKPPLAFWVQAASAKVFGFNSWSLLVPQAAAGVAAVYVLYRIVKAQAGPLAGLIAALALTVTPITVAVNRDNNPDTMMVLLLLLAAWAAQSAISAGSFRKLALAGVFIGLAFTTKMLQAYIVVPGLALAFLVAAATGWRRRVGYLLGAGAIMAAVSAAWMVAVDLVPKADRPYVGGSTNDTVANLVFGYNGFGRVNGDEGNGFGGAGRGVGAAFGGQAGLGRLFDDAIGGQIGWLIPFAGLALVAGLILGARRPLADPVRGALLMWGGWGIACWAVFSYSKGIFHSYYTAELAPALAALTGIGLAAMIGLARRRSPWAGIYALGAIGSAVVEVILLRRSADWNAWLRPTVIALAIAAAVGVVVVLAVRVPRPAARWLVAGTGAAALVAVLAGPAAYAVTPVTRAGGGSDPQAGPTVRDGLGGRANQAGAGRGGAGAGGGGTNAARIERALGDLSASQRAALRGAVSSAVGGNGSRAGFNPAGGGGIATLVGGFGRGGGSLSTALVTYLERNQGGAKYLVAVSGAPAAEQTIIDTGRAVLPMGGFSGGDPAPTLAQFEALVTSGQLRYVLGAAGGGRAGGGFGAFGGGDRGGGRGGSSTANRTAWITAHCRAVSPAAYRGPTATSTGSTDTLYDCAGAKT